MAQKTHVRFGFVNGNVKNRHLTKPAKIHNRFAILPIILRMTIHSPGGSGMCMYNGLKLAHAEKYKTMLVWLLPVQTNKMMLAILMETIKEKLL